MIEGVLLLLMLMAFMHLYRNVDKSMRGGRNNISGLFEFRELRNKAPMTKKKA
ncbi:MAG: hypothetical protein JO253_02685 [Alphaproteobacteria bacterium]|nr:hypothetical protein [Alphaproteobacteria bacterium]MBV8380874.1 hypothetical protein [Roseateles sp.]